MRSVLILVLFSLVALAEDHDRLKAVTKNGNGKARPETSAPAKEKEKEKIKAVTDAELFQMIFKEKNYSYYKGNEKRTPSQGGPHGFIVTKFNSTARDTLSKDGTLGKDAEFPEGSFIVKESFGDETGPRTFYSVMLKRRNDPNAVAGWVWAEFYADGRPYFSTTRGGFCAGCHSGSEARDSTLIFNSHP